MLLSRMKSALWLVSLLLPLTANDLPTQDKAPELFRASDKGLFHKAQRSKDGILVLNANNGFFDKGKVKAIGKKAGKPHEKDLISASFDELQFLPKKEDAKARWYLWSAEAGEIKIETDFGNHSPSPGEWSFQIDDHSAPLGEPISIQAGKQKVTLLRNGTPKEAANIKSLTLSGEPIKTAAVLRARWRPAAIHSKFAAKGCPKPMMWIFESHSVADGSSYSPMTTSFGYFGATFGADRKAAGGVNFSMWALSHKGGKDTLPPLSQMPHLWAVGNPEAEFGGFGHEGSGVKIRNWTPYEHQPTSVIQALRVEKNGPYHTYYGYLFDEQTNQWILYTAGNKVLKPKASSHLRATAFCEVPGPPQVERTGDQQRVLERRGWFFDASGKIFPVDKMSTKAHLQNHDIALSDDHWFQVKTGGLEFRNVPAKVETDFIHPLPEFLQPEKLKQLYELPATIGESQVVVEKTSAKVSYDISKSGTKATGVLWFGEIDAITFVPREMHSTERGRDSEKLFSKDRVWSHQATVKNIRKGENIIELDGLKPGTKYFHRLLVKNEEGKIWAKESGSFSTKP
ncbi:MAG: hypothetical protein ACI9NQ_001269 [Paracoccaceae bacterium]|jgi:hypothetical protein